MNPPPIHIKLGFVNVYLLTTDDGFILIDTGIKGKYDALKKALEIHGCEPGKLRLIILTHGDTDHSGNCDALQQEYSTPQHKVMIAMHKSDYDMLKSWNLADRRIKPFFMRMMFTLMKSRFLKNRPTVTFKPDVLLRDDQTLNEYGLDARVIHVPGHTAGSIAVITAEGDLFSGDTVINWRKPTFAQIIENQDQLDGSIKKLKDIDFKHVFPGHGKPFTIGRFEDIRI